MKSVLCLVFCALCSFAVAGEEKSVLVPTPAAAPVAVAPVVSAPVAVVSAPVAVECRGSCCGTACRLYNEKVTEEDRCRRTLRGGYVKRQVVRKVYSPVR
jgi:hypothetical protein